MILGAHVRVRLWLLVIILSALTACRAAATARLPDTDIVFQTMTEERTPYVLGFVSADGSKLVYVETRLFSGGMPVFPAQTSDGDLLIFHGVHGDDSRSTGPLSTITSDGHLVQYDQDFFWGSGWVAPIQDSHQIVIAEPYTGGLPKNIQDHIQRLDLETKKVVQTYVDVKGEVLEIGTNALHDVNLVYVHKRLIDDEYPVTRTVLLNTETGMETTLAIEEDGHLYAPAISPDGQWVAYTAKDGIYIVSVKGDEPKLMVETCAIRERPEGRFTWDPWPPAPSWSPDSKWLVYHRCALPCPEWCEETEDYSVFKVNVETGRETLLVEGGLNPYWRLNPATVNVP